MTHNSTVKHVSGDSLQLVAISDRPTLTHVSGILKEGAAKSSLGRMEVSQEFNRQESGI
jgi:hypothetical protein